MFVVFQAMWRTSSKTPASGWSRQMLAGKGMEMYLIEEREILAGKKQELCLNKGKK